MITIKSQTTIFLYFYFIYLDCIFTTMISIMVHWHNQYLHLIWTVWRQKWINEAQIWCAVLYKTADVNGVMLQW